ncbi:unnamed protein product [Nyctereutes procyonoides]|uniref:(raccoon dog) hypothetical protein n=1 Tax=Nyctereutes procyonoides TaxID=34880 RepID=A0A811YVQ1_NYCPR|nr:unnamed protein product [Nyctereutes procyonoides]
MSPKFNTNHIKIIYLRCTGEEVSAMSTLVPKISPLGLYPKIEVVPSVSTLINKALKESPKDRRKQKNIKHARELSGTIKNILRTAQAVGCSVVGCCPHDITDDISSGAVECPVS